MNQEATDRYFSETSLVLRREGFQVNHFLGDRLEVSRDGQTLCKVIGIAGVTCRASDIDTPERMEAIFKAQEIARTTADYMRKMEQAPTLEVSSLRDQYRVLADFGNTVLAGSYGKYGVEFVTWDWDHDRKGVSQGHYFDGDYQGAKQDFAIRSGLVPKDLLFSDEQLATIYRCCTDVLEEGLCTSCEQEKSVEGVLEQIKYGMPDVVERLTPQEHNTAGPTPLEQTM